MFIEELLFIKHYSKLQTDKNTSPNGAYTLAGEDNKNIKYIYICIYVYDMYMQGTYVVVFYRVARVDLIKITFKQRLESS